MIRALLLCPLSSRKPCALECTAARAVFAGCPGFQARPQSLPADGGEGSDLGSPKALLLRGHVPKMSIQLVQWTVETPRQNVCLRRAGPISLDRPRLVGTYPQLPAPCLSEVGGRGHPTTTARAAPELQGQDRRTLCSRSIPLYAQPPGCAQVTWSQLGRPSGTGTTLHVLLPTGG